MLVSLICSSPGLKGLSCNIISVGIKQNMVLISTPLYYNLQTKNKTKPASQYTTANPVTLLLVRKISNHYATVHIAQSALISNQ